MKVFLNKFIISILSIIALTCMVSCATNRVDNQKQDEATYYRVERIVDGDTLVLETLGKIRLIGVDTPETKDPRKPVQYFGKEASEFLTRLALGKTVRVEYDQNKMDKYKRTLAYLFLADGTFINAQIIEQGYGHAYTLFPFKYLEQFRTLQRQAREQKRGLWGQNPGDDAE